MTVAVLACGSSDLSSSPVASGGIGGGFVGAGGPGVRCKAAAECSPGQVCCQAAGNAAGFATCQAGACPPDNFQLCAVSAECLPEGYWCPPEARTSIGGSSFCIPPEDAGADDGSADDASDGPSPVDAPWSDGPQSGDSAAGTGVDASNGDGGLPDADRLDSATRDAGGG
jgi:hypothetical protein